jgi:hypothetical protein
LKKTSFLLALTFLIFFIVSCIEPFEIAYNTTENVLLVEAVVDNLDNREPIIIRSSTPSSYGTSTIEPVKGLQVTVLVNGGESKQYTESKVDPGNYFAPNGFVAEAGKNYQLVLKMPNGTKYVSTSQKINEGLPIKKLYQKFETTGGKPIDRNFKAFHNIYLDTDDIPGKGNNYIWTWKLYEKQDVCRSCEPQERYYPNPAPEGKCVKDLPNFLARQIYDYFCDGNCWEIIHSRKINIMNDDFSDGKTITGRLVDQIPYYQYKSALIEVTQSTLNNEGYRYYKILADQSQNTGGLADTPPASLIGNISNESNSKEAIAGFFRVAKVSRKTYWIDREDVPDKSIKPLGLLGGRDISPEPSGTDTTRPPYALCIPSYSRTNVKPLGWLGL